MKAQLIQPRYSMDCDQLERCVREELELLDRCDESADVIVLPEYSDVPAAVPDDRAFLAAMERYGPVVAEKAARTAERCRAMTFANYGQKTPRGWRNTTHVFDRNGREVGRYVKQHPAPSEIANPGMDTDDCGQGVYTVEMEGIRFGFRTCYDFYFYEDIVEMARERLDIIIGCSYQRTDTHDALEIMNRFLAYNTNAYVLRSSISLGPDSPVCGCSMAVAPDGRILANMKNRVGIETVEFDVREKYYKQAGFHGAPMAHYEYVDAGRRREETGR